MSPCAKAASGTPSSSSSSRAPEEEARGAHTGGGADLTGVSGDSTAAPWETTAAELGLGLPPVPAKMVGDAAAGGGVLVGGTSRAGALITTGNDVDDQEHLF